MSIIGSSTGIRTAAATEIGSVPAVAATDRNLAAQAPVRTAAAAPPLPAGAAASAATTVTSTALDVGAVPIDQARVASIKKAIATHSYPLIPARVGDAMIAAGMLLRMAK